MPNDVLNLGKFVEKKKAVVVDDVTYEFSELTMMQALQLFELGDRMERATDVTELQACLVEFARRMDRIVPESNREVWEKLTNEQIRQVISYLHPFASRTTAKPAETEEANSKNSATPKAPRRRKSPSTSR